MALSPDLVRDLDELAAATGDGLVVSVSRGDDVLLERAHGHAPSGAVALEGCDAGVSFRSVHEPATGLTHTVMAATTDGAWPLSRRLAELEGR